LYIFANTSAASFVANSILSSRDFAAALVLPLGQPTLFVSGGFILMADNSEIVVSAAPPRKVPEVVALIFATWLETFVEVSREAAVF
jgi:hypothetical protein